MLRAVRLKDDDVITHDSLHMVPMMTSLAVITTLPVMSVCMH